MDNYNLSKIDKDLEGFVYYHKLGIIAFNEKDYTPDRVEKAIEKVKELKSEIENNGNK